MDPMHFMMIRHLPKRQAYVQADFVGEEENVIADSTSYTILQYVVVREVCG